MSVTKFPSTPTPIAAALHAAFVGVAFATGAGGIAPSAHAGAGSGEESNQRSFRIPAGPLGPALSQFATVAGARLSFDPALTEGKTTRGLSGDFTREEGLAALLAGTGLEWAPGPGGTYTVRVQARPEAPVPTGEQPVELDPITVTAQPIEQGFKANMQETATKTPLSIRETPQSVSVVTRDSLRARQVIGGLGQALETSAGVTRSREAGPFAGRSSVGAPDFEIRGIRIDSTFNVLEDGFIAPQIVGDSDLALFERVEVVKGPSSVLYGRGSAGGFINQVRKKPLPEFFAEVAPSIGSFDFYRVEGDVTGPLFASDRARGRLVLAYEDAGSFVDFLESERIVAAPSLEFDLTESTRLLLQGTYQQDDFVPHYGVPLRADGENFKAPDVRRSLFFGVPNASVDDSSREALTGALQLEQELGDRWLATLRLSRSDQNARENTDSYAYGLTEIGDTQLYSVAFDQDFDVWSGEVRLNGSLDLFGREADITVGADHSEFDYSLRGGFFALGTANIYAENFADFPTVEPDPSIRFARKLESTGVYGQLHLRPLERLGVLMGGRYDWADTFNSESFGDEPTISDKRDSDFTWRAGLTYRLWEPVSIYGLYAQPFSPILFATGRNGALEPEIGEIYEAGIKTEWLDGRLGINAALFRIDRDDVAIQDPNNGPGEFFSVNAGLQRSDGFELEINGELLPGWNLSFGGILLDSEFIERDDPNFGNSPLGAADWQVGLYTSS